MTTAAPTPSQSQGAAGPSASVAAEVADTQSGGRDLQVRSGVHTRDSSFDASESTASLLKVAGSVVAPTTFVTALLIYFGWSHAYSFFNYFGINSTVLELTTQDYLMRSVDGLFIPLTVLAGIGMVGIWAHRLLRRWIPTQWQEVGRRYAPSSRALIGLVLAVIGLYGVAAQTPFEKLSWIISPVSLGLGAILLTSGARTGPRARPPLSAYAASTPRWITLWAWAGMFVLVGLSLFWVANDYSVAVGTSRARTQERRLPKEPGLVIYSAQSLSLKGPGVRETECAASDAAYRYRYDGLTLVMQAADQYVILPEAWSRHSGTAILMPRSDTVRLEFIPPGTPNPRPAAC